MRSVLAVAIVAVVAAAALPAQDRTRFDIVSFELPPGWTATPAGDALHVDAPQRAARVVVAKSTRMTQTLSALAKERLAAAESRAEFRLESPLRTERHARSRGAIGMFACSYRHPDDAAKFRYELDVLHAAGGRSTSFVLTTDSVTAYEAHRAGFGAMLTSLASTATEILEAGRPPLTRYLLDESFAFLEWLVHSPMTELQRATIEAELRGYWKDGVRDEIDGIVELLAAREELAKLPEGERELARQAALDAALKSWRDEVDSKSAKTMLDLHAAANAPIAAGDPPLTQQAVTAYAEFLYFAAGRTVGVDAKVTTATRDALTASVAKGYAEMTQDARERIAEMPVLWAALRVAWPHLGDERQKQIVDAWKQDDAIQRIGKQLELQKAQESMREMMSRQAQMQAMQAHYAMMSNVMRMNADTARIIASNMGGNTRYEYRW
jgi:hypothetical protein